MLLLKNVRYIDREIPAITQGDLVVEEGESGGIRLLTSPSVAAPACDEMMDCQGKFVMKSFVNAHHHSYSALSRGMPPVLPAPGNFAEILSSVWWKLDKALDQDTIRYSALYTALASAKSGCTFVIDHHSSPACVENSLGILAEAYESLGISHLLCFEISDRNGQAVAEKSLDETDTYLREKQGLVGLHASFTLTDDTLKRVSGLCRKHATGIHVHVAEDPVDQKITMEKYHCRVVERFARQGLLEYPGTLLSHCLHLDGQERELIRNSGVFIAQNAESNLNNQVGYFNATGLGDRIMLGTDGMHSDLLRSMQYAYFFGLDHEFMNPEVAVRRLFQADNYLKINNFKGNGENNLLILDYDSPVPLTADNLYSHLIYGLTSNHIQHVIAKGKWIIHDRKLVTADEEEILAGAREGAQRLWKKMKLM